MKIRNIRLILAILMFISILMFSNRVEAVSFSITSSKNSVTVGEDFNITINGTGLTGKYEVKGSSNIKINGDTNPWIENTSLTLTCNAISSGKATITITPITVANSETGKDIENLQAQTLSVTVNEKTSTPEPTPTAAAKSTEAILKNLGIKPNDFTGFRQKKKEYSVEVPNSTSEVEVYAEALKGEIISGTGKVSLKEGETTTVNVVVKAEAGNTETYTLKIKRRTAEEEAQSASDATLKNLGINPKEYDFSGFKKDQTEYSVEVPNEIKTVEIYAEATDSKAQVTGTGEIELNEGANEAKVEVVAQDGTKKTYIITITRKASEVATTSLDNTKFGLSNLTIAGQIISPAFKNDVYSYTVGVKEDLASLDIKATATDSDAKIEIVGNENLQQGENTITVIVKNEKTNQTATYQITVNKNVVSEAKQRSFFNPSTWGKEMIIKSIIVAVLVLLIIIAVVLKVKISKEAKMENGQDNDENIGFPGADELDKAIAEHQELTENNGENEENKTKNYVENDAKTEEKMKEIDVEKNDANSSGRRKGKHF